MPSRVSRTSYVLMALMMFILFAQLALIIILGYTSFFEALLKGKNWSLADNARPSNGGVLTAKTLVIQGQNGGLIWIGERRGQMCIDLKDQNGRSKAFLSLNADSEPVLSLFDQNETPMIVSGSILKGKLLVSILDRTSSASHESQVNSDKLEEQIKIVGSKTSNKYHYQNCKWIKLLKPHRLNFFDSIKSARELGYVPCLTCSPPVDD